MSEDLSGDILSAIKTLVGLEGGASVAQTILGALNELIAAIQAAAGGGGLHIMDDLGNVDVAHVTDLQVPAGVLYDGGDGNASLTDLALLDGDNTFTGDNLFTGGIGADEWLDATGNDTLIHNAAASLDVYKDIRFAVGGAALILLSPDATPHRIIVANDGTVSSESVH